MDELIRELKHQGVLKLPSVEEAFWAIDRKGFVQPEYASEAYGNYPLPIGEGQTVSQPYTVAFMLDLLDPKPGEKILDAGAGSGWTTALLAWIVSEKQGVGSGKQKSVNSEQGAVNRSRTAGRVYAIERIPKLCEFGKENVAKYNFLKRRIVTFVCGDATRGLPKRAPFDKILSSAAAGDAVPDAWREQLRVGGRIVAPVGGSLWCIVKTSPTSWQKQEFPGFAFVPLVTERSKKPSFAKASAGRQEATSRKQEPVTSDQETASEPRRGSLQKHLRILLLALCSLFAVTVVADAYATLAPVTAPRTNADVEIPTGSGSRVIGELLKSHGVIRSKWAFISYTTLAGSAADLKAGFYTFDGPVTIPDVVRQLVRGERYPNERVITIPEGWDVRDLGRYLEEQGLFEADTWWATVGLPAHDYRNEKAGLPDFSGEFSFLKDKPAYAGLEGYLYPDTYRVFRDATAEDVARKMLANFDRKLPPELRAEIARQEKTIFAVVTVASLIEKEVVDDRDRRIAAGILWKRLRAGMPLQVDASVNYVTGKHESPSAADLAINSTFNTYRSAGLPLGPIANPGIEAIRAAIFPQESPYLYYLTAPDGKTIFSLTFEEHVAAKAHYLR